LKAPYLIQGGSHTDNRGTISFVNGFTLPDINRFYTITQSPENGPRAWQGHRHEYKHFYCSKGAFLIALVKIDDWEKPSEHLDYLTFELHAEKSQVLVVPGGYANGMLARADDSQLIVFSQWTVEEALHDEFRFDKSRWINWNKI
jgi:dTDP-4-dehydrorhamnose 3,5-epimerase